MKVSLSFMTKKCTAKAKIVDKRPFKKLFATRIFVGLMAVLCQTNQMIDNKAFAQNSNAGMSEAQKFFRAGDYAKSARFFYLVVTSAEGEVRAAAEFGLAESLRKLGLPYSAAYFHMRQVAQGARSNFFRAAMESISEINGKSPLGRASLLALVNAKKIDPLTVPPNARGFYFFYRGLDAFEKQNISGAKGEFERVPSGNPYYAPAQYYLGVILTVLKDLDGALGAFNRVIRASPSENIQNLATTNLARIYFEMKEYRKAFGFYSQIPRDSDLWLEILFEGSWAFFHIQRHNNTLGNIHTIHSPFFVNRFFPETYILNAITYLRLCRYSSVEKQLQKFQQRYKPIFADLNNMLKRYQNQPAGFYSLISGYKASNRLKEFAAAVEVIDSISRSDAYKEAQKVVRGLDREKAQLENYRTRWDDVGLTAALRDSFESRRTATIQVAGEELFASGISLFKYLKDLSDQTKLINLEILSGKTDELRNKFVQDAPPPDSTQWGEGMRPLNLKAELEYWPFEGEYWEDELGGYVYNIDSKCGGAKPANNNKK